MMKQLLLAVTLCDAIVLTMTAGSAAQAQRPGQEQRFDELIRADFFAGVARRRRRLGEGDACD